MRGARALTGSIVLAIALMSGAAPAAREAGSCVVRAPAAEVGAPRHIRTISTGETGWFSSPGLVDLDGDRKLEIVAPFYSTFVFSATGKLLGKGTATKGRVYAPGAVVDLDRDGRKEIVVGGNEGSVAAYELRAGGLRLEQGWPASTCSGGECPETRGLAAADLDGDGRVEVIATTTNTSGEGSQVFVFAASGRLYQPRGTPFPAWPRYNTRGGKGGDADFNGTGNHGYGAFGENVGVGNLDDDPQLEIVVTFDNHQLNVFNHDGTSMLASPWFRNRESGHAGRRLGFGQFIRWLDPTVEANHYHRHVGPWPDVKKTMWLQWTDSPPSVADLDRDGRNEVIAVANAEQKEPYETQGHAFVVLDGAQRGGARAARRHPGFERPFLTGKPSVRPSGDWYPPSGIPAPTVVNLTGDARPEIVSATPDGKVYAVSPAGRLLWSFDYARGQPKTFASEVVAADLNRDGRPELVLGTYALTPNAGRLIVLSGSGRLLHDVRLPRQGSNGNGIGIAAAPSIGDLDGDTRLEIVVTTFDHGLDVFRVPRSAPNCLPWPTGRGGLLRHGTGPATAR